MMKYNILSSAIMQLFLVLHDCILHSSTSVLLLHNKTHWHQYIMNLKSESELDYQGWTNNLKYTFINQGRVQTALGIYRPPPSAPPPLSLGRLFGNYRPWAGLLTHVPNMTGFYFSTALCSMISVHIRKGLGTFTFILFNKYIPYSPVTR